MKIGKIIRGSVAAVSFLVLILDTHTALEGAKEGINLCLSTVVPTLFPFIFTSSWLISTFQGGKSKAERRLCTLFRCPEGSGSILISGFLGGYPVGARCIGQAVTAGQLSRDSAQKMIVYCNAAGPAFIFGILGPIFPQPWIPWVLWAIHIISAVSTAWLLPNAPHQSQRTKQRTTISLTEVLKQSVKSISEVCGWIILMRLLICILQKWCLWLLPQAWSIAIIGFLELSNGCLFVNALDNPGLKLILCSTFLGFGGLCVALQTASAARGVKQTLYLLGKLLQAGISLLIAYVVQLFLFCEWQTFHFPFLLFFGIIIILIVCVSFIKKYENSCGILESVDV